MKTGPAAASSVICVGVPAVPRVIILPVEFLRIEVVPDDLNCSLVATLSLPPRLID